jgi:hypothetical protein
MSSALECIAFIIPGLGAGPIHGRLFEASPEVAGGVVRRPKKQGGEARSAGSE